MKNPFNFFKKKKINPYMEDLTKISIEAVLPANFLLYSLATALHLSEGRLKDFPEDSKAKNFYYVGGTFCIDFVNENNEMEVLTVNTSTKDYGSFTRNFKRKGLSPEEYKFLMQLNKIWDKNQNYEN